MPPNALVDWIKTAIAYDAVIAIALMAVVGWGHRKGLSVRDRTAVTVRDARVQFCGLLRRKRPGEREKEPGTKRQPRSGTQAWSLTLTTAGQQRCHSL